MAPVAQVGELVDALFSDDMWYPATVTSIEPSLQGPMYHIRYDGFGNTGKRGTAPSFPLRTSHTLRES